MVKPPSIADIAAWLKTYRPLGLREPITVSDIDPKPWSGHFNYLVTTPEQRFILRFKGPEWGEALQGIVDEYENLKTLEPYAVGPRVLGLAQDFFGEPAMFMEYLEGKDLGSLPNSDQRRLFPEVVRLVLAINLIAYRELRLRMAEPYVSYERHRRSWQERLEVIARTPALEIWAVRLRNLLPRAESMLERFEPRLKRVLDASGPAFLFLSSHVGHCWATPAGLRFINWEEVSFGDPSFTLAVFLASLSTRQDFLSLQESMVGQYVERRAIPEFRELVDQRLAEREISNLFWVLWAYANRKDTAPPDEATGAAARYARVRAILDHFGV